MNHLNMMGTGLSRIKYVKVRLMLLHRDQISLVKLVAAELCKKKKSSKNAGIENYLRKGREYHSQYRRAVRVLS